MKTEFELEYENKELSSSWIEILSPASNGKVKVRVLSQRGTLDLYIPNKDLERFALNILKALKGSNLK